MRLLNVREMWKFRELLFHLALRDIQISYKQTLLGALCYGELAAMFPRFTSMGAAC